MPDITIRDNYGDPLSVNWVAGEHRCWMETGEGALDDPIVELDRKAVRKVRRVLKQFLRESKN